MTQAQEIASILDKVHEPTSYPVLFVGSDVSYLGKIAKSKAWARLTDLLLVQYAKSATKISRATLQEDDRQFIIAHN